MEFVANNFTAAFAMSPTLKVVSCISCISCKSLQITNKMLRQLHRTHQLTVGDNVSTVTHLLHC